MITKQHFFPECTMDKLKPYIVANDSKHSRNLYEFFLYATVSSLHVVFLLFNIASYYKCMFHTVNIRGGASLNAKITAADKTINT